MRETQETITRWADKTFGKTTVAAAFKRAEKEWIELQTDMRSGDLDRARREVVDVLICLYRLASELGIHLEVERDIKMSINRKRRWRSNGDGTGQHIPELSGTGEGG